MSAGLSNLVQTMVRAFYQTVIQPCKKKHQRKLEVVGLFRALQTHIQFQILEAPAQALTLQTTVIDLEKKNKLQDKTQRQQREKKSTEFLPFYLKKRKEIQKRNRQNQNSPSIPSPLCLAKKSTYIFVCTLKIIISLRLDGPKLKSQIVVRSNRSLNRSREKRA